MKHSILLILYFVVSVFAQAQDSFSFVFMTDVHLKDDSLICANFNRAIDRINNCQPDFVVDGGDFIFDMNDEVYDEAKGALQKYETAVSRLQSPLYNVIGNHDVLGVTKKYRTTVDPNYQGKKVFERFFNDKTYYTFNHKGWQFFVLDCIQLNDSTMLEYYIDSKQLEWLSETLDTIDEETPIVLFSHVPFFSASAMYRDGSLARNSSVKVMKNTKDILKCFKHHNLRLTLSGHLHQYESITIDNKQFVVGGAICGFWWRGAFGTTAEGFTKVDIVNGEAKITYVPY